MKRSRFGSTSITGFVFMGLLAEPLGIRFTNCPNTYPIAMKSSHIMILLWSSRGFSKSLARNAHHIETMSTNHTQSPVHTSVQHQQRMQKLIACSLQFRRCLLFSCSSASFCLSLGGLLFLLHSFQLKHTAEGFLKYT